MFTFQRRKPAARSRLHLEPLEDRTMLSYFATLAAGLDGVLSNVSTYNGPLDQLVGTHMPEIATAPFLNGHSGLLRVDSFITSFQSQLKTTLGALPDSSSVSDVQNALFTLLGPKSLTNPKGLGVLGDTDNDGTIDSKDIFVTITGSGTSNFSIDLEARLEKVLTDVGTSQIAFGIGLPAIPFAITQNGGVHLQVGIEYEMVAHFDASKGFARSVQSRLRHLCRKKIRV